LDMESINKNAVASSNHEILFLLKVRVFAVRSKLASYIEIRMPLGILCQLRTIGPSLYSHPRNIKTITF
jgi:hypothetical protein